MAELTNLNSEGSRDRLFKTQSGENGVCESPSKEAVYVTQSEKCGNCDTQYEKNGNCDTQSEKNGNCDTQSEKNGNCDTQSEKNGNCDTQSEKNGNCDTQSEKNGNCDTQSEKNVNCDTKSENNGNRVSRTESKVNGVSRTQSKENGVTGTESEENGACETQSEENGVSWTHVENGACETLSRENCVCEEMKKVTDESEDENLDVTDGFISNYLKNQTGTYKPRNYEKESWGTDTDKIAESDDKHEELFQLLKSTAPEVRWRQGLFYIFKQSKSEKLIRKCLAFLYSNVAIGISTAEKGSSATVPMELNSAPECLGCDDWMAVMEGLNFELTSPDTVRNIEDVEVAIGKKTDTNALTGFCFLMKALLDLSWTNLQTLLQLEEKDGQLLHNALAMLCSGCGIDASERSCIEEIENRHPYLIKSLGFRRSHNQSRLQWQKPHPDNEFQNLCLALHGLFRAAGNIESIL